MTVFAAVAVAYTPSHLDDLARDRARTGIWRCLACYVSSDDQLYCIFFWLVPIKLYKLIRYCIKMLLNQ